MDYLRLGIAHILEGWDHLLFIAALVLACTSFWDFVKVVTAFTVAHTLTLAISAFGYLRLPSSVVEPMIALSIVVVAMQNVFFPKSARGRTRLVIAFIFGPFHGLGFAGGTEPRVMVVLQVPKSEFSILDIVSLHIRDDFEKTMAVRIATEFLEESKKGVVAHL